MMMQFGRFEVRPVWAIEHGTETGDEDEARAYHTEQGFDGEPKPVAWVVWDYSGDEDAPGEPICDAYTLALAQRIAAALDAADEPGFPGLSRGEYAARMGL